MVAVTQLTPNFLGGVSRQVDDKKKEGQVTDCVNGYPDPTYGMLKRPGMDLVKTLRDSSNNVYQKTDLEDASWFFIQRTATESYIGAIKGSDIYVWNTDGTACTVTNSGASYLTGTDPNDYHFRSIQDTTVITNKKITTAMQAAPSFNANRVGTIVLKIVEYSSTYTAVVAGQTCEFKTYNQDVFANPGDTDTKLNADYILTGLKNAIDAKGISGLTVTKYRTSLELSRTSSFTLEAFGGTNNESIVSFQDEVDDVSNLPEESATNRVVKVVNAAGIEEDDYYVKYTDDTWQETLSPGPDVSPGLDASTLPHELISTALNTFTFQPITWAPRLVGDNTTNKEPSFVGYPITSTFFYNNRFGMLSEDNIIMSAANDSFNFFNRSALTQVDSDPIDLNTASIQPVVLSDVIPAPQGLVIFSRRQQFLLFAADTGVLTPSTAVIRSLSNYEMDTNISPVDIGTNFAFVNKVPQYTRVFSMKTRGLEENPIVIDISKAVIEWIPSEVSELSVSPENSTVILGSRDTTNMYVFRFYNDGEKDLFQAWTRWTLPGDIQGFDVINDSIFTVIQYEDEYAIGKIALDELPTGTVVSDGSTITGNACLDMVVRPESPDGGVTDSVVYDLTNDITKVYVPFTPIDNKEAFLLLTRPSSVSNPADADAGFYTSAIERVEIGTGYKYFEIDGNLKDYEDGIVVGYPYDFEVTLPKFYYRRDENTTDYTAMLTIARAKFSIGRTGAVQFKLKPIGSNEWKNVQHVAEADYYSADSNPVKSEQQFTVPINQRNMNFELKVTSNYPYPVSLVSMMWEGNYSPRFYRRS